MSETIKKKKEKPAFPEKAVLIAKGNKFEEFKIGQVFEHHWGRTLNSGDNSLFTTLTLHFNPMYFNEGYAKQHGHEKIVLNPLLIFNTVLGLSVEDLSEAGGPFLGINDLIYHKDMYEGDTINAVSTVLDKRESAKRPTMGIVTWHTKGYNQDGELTIEFKRSNLVAKKGQMAKI